MKEQVKIKLNDVVFTCASCNSKIEIKSVLKQKEVSIDVCDKCHPFYIGASVGQQAKGRAEQFNKKVKAVQSSSLKRPKKEIKKDTKVISKSFKDLKNL